MYKKIIWPQNKKFAFTIVDDTDLATLENIKPIYDYLDLIGIRTTKTVWVFGQNENIYEHSDTLEREEYLNYILDLKQRGFEIALHGVRGTSTKRISIIDGIEKFNNLLGNYPRIHVNHAQNLDNIYWGFNRLFSFQKFFHKIGIRKYSLKGLGYGGDQSSEYFWGDIVRDKIDFVRGNTFDDINLLNKDPYTPYYEKRFGFVKAWFSSSNGSQIGDIIKLLSIENQDRLEAENGLCIVYTHFGTKGFLNENGEINDELKYLLLVLSKREGWFAPASEILDYISNQRGVTKVNSLMHWLRTR